MPADPSPLAEDHRPRQRPIMGDWVQHRDVRHVAQHALTNRASSAARAVVYSPNGEYVAYALPES
jgi:hypothetical protein